MHSMHQVSSMVVGCAVHAARVIDHMHYQQGTVYGTLNAAQPGVTGLLLLGLIMVVCDHTIAQDDT